MIPLLSPGVLPGDLVPAEFHERLLQPGIQDRGESSCGRLLAAQGCVTPQFRPQSAALVSIYPDKEPRVRGRGRAISHTVGPILGEAVVLGGRGQATVGHCQPHGDVGPVAGYVVPP